MMKYSITVYIHKGYTDMPDKFEVEAVCVDGDTGVFAVYDHPTNSELFCMAVGDDGHWLQVAVYHKHWARKILAGMTEYWHTIPVK